MEDSKRNSFYDLLANSKVNGQEEENKKTMIADLD